MTVSGAKERVLVVDDDEGGLFLLSEKMRSAGYEVETARNGMEAISKSESFLPDLVLLDVMMPLMDGYEACRRLKTGEKTRYTPVIMLTAKGELEDKLVGLDAGADDYIVKPYSMPEVSARVKSMLRMRSLQSQLSESEKMAALGEMVDGIAHEIRNPLVTIGGMARRLKDKEQEEERRYYADNILKAVLRMERMMARIDEYKGILSPWFEKGDLSEVLKSVVDDSRAFASEMQNVSINAEGIDKPILMDMASANLKTAFFNVIQNAIEAVDHGGGSVTVRALKDDADGVVSVEVKDNGVGMDKETIKSIFHPFYTSKMTGAGLGLTIAYRIAKDHGGTIEVESEKGRGTTVTVKLPATQAVRA